MRSKIDWTSVEHADRRQWLEFCRELLDCRRREIVPRIKDLAAARNIKCWMQPLFVFAGPLSRVATWNLWRISVGCS